MDISEFKRTDLEKQGYRIVGNHSAIKVCHWTKKSMKSIELEDSCYKCKFYGIQTWRCVQMTPSVPYCSLRCEWCWRDIEFTSPKWDGKVDEPKDIVDGCISAHIKYLQGFGGNDKVEVERFLASQEPLHFAISLSGEPTLYPKLPELIDEINSRGMTSFLVTNGTNPEMVERLIERQPTQFYMTLPAPNKDVFEKVCKPLVHNAWDRIIKTLDYVSKFKRSVLRLTLAKDVNLVDPQGYAELILKGNPTFVECKAYVWVGYSRERLAMENMPRHEEIVEFSNEMLKFLPGWKMIDAKENSRVVLLAKEDFDGRVMEF